MTLYFVIIISLAKPHDNVDPNSKITIHPYGTKNGECKPPLNNEQMWCFHIINPQWPEHIHTVNMQQNP